MKKTVITGAMVLCLLLVGSVTAYAAGGLEFSLPDGLKGKPETNFTLPEGFGGNFEAIQADMRSRIEEMSEKASDMSAYTQFGLDYDESKGGYCHDGKLVGLFVDKQGNRVSFLNKNGEVHIKAVRDDNGNLTGLVELNADEYNAIIAEMDDLKSDMQAHMDEMRRGMEERINESSALFHSGEFDPATFRNNMEETRKSMQERMSQIRAEMEQRLNGSMDKIGN